MKYKIKIRHYWFIPWIFNGYEEHELIEAWESGKTIEDYALAIFGMIPVRHIANWKEIKHHYDIDNHDGYVYHIPNTLEVEWVKEEA